MDMSNKTLKYKLSLTQNHEKYTENNNMKIPKFEPVEPKTATRWILNTIGINLHSYLFSKYEIYNDGDKLMFETSCYETVKDDIYPNELFNLTGFELLYLDPTGEVIGGFQFNIKSFNFKTSGNYGNDDLLRYHFTIEIDRESLKPKFLYKG
jgi:hypothetical protein